jgi:hypothetical protein
MKNTPSRNVCYRICLLFLLIHCSSGYTNTENAATDSTRSVQCQLSDLTALITQPELVTDNGISPETAYRKLLSRFVSLHYTKVARDIVHGHGEYLKTLHHLMGIDEHSASDCNLTLREMLLSSAGPASFTQALLLLRFATPVELQAPNTTQNTETAETVAAPF